MHPLLELGKEWLLAAPEQSGSLSDQLERALATALELPDGVALEALRRLPFVSARTTGDEPGVEAAAIALDGDRLRDRLWVERAASEPLPRARTLLAAADARATAGELSSATASLVRWWYARTAPFEAARPLFEQSLAPTFERASDARDAFTRLVTAGLRQGRAHEVAALQSELAVAHPEQPAVRLEAAASWLLASVQGHGAIDAHALAAARTELAAVRAAVDGRLDTAALEQRGSAELGVAWLALLTGDSSAAHGALERAARPPRPLLAQEDALHAQQLRVAMVAAFVRSGDGAAATDAQERFAAALAAAPVDQTRSIANDAWFGSFGPLFGRELLLLAGRAAEWCAVGHELQDALEASHGRHGHGLLARSSADDEATAARPAAWCFLGVAEGLLVGCGDPAAAAALLAPRLAPLEASSDWSLRELAGETELLRARIELQRGDPTAALAACDTALRIAREIHSGLVADHWQRQAQGEVPPPPAAQRIGRSELPSANLVVRALVTRSGVKATLLGDAIGAAHDLFEAGSAWPWDGDRWLRCATDFARRGRLAEARACLLRVDPTVDRAYDLACFHAWCGETDAALAQLERHLGWAGRTPATRAQEVRYAARDHDLAALRDHPRFPRS
ncbi:MAG: hypothetical protein JNL90_09470 [Planctomycetes bacterium]|nr:hypothetical protein [Planctomycetota bacterium]